MSKILGNEAPEEGPTVLAKSKEYAKKKEQEDEQYLKIKEEVGPLFINSNLVQDLFIFLKIFYQANYCQAY